MRLLALRTILVASDLTPASDGAVRTALALSRAAGATLHVVHVAADTHDKPLADDRRAHYRSTLDSAVRAIGAKDDEVAIHIATGEPPPAIRHPADKVHADVVVLGRGGADGSAIHDRPLGGTAYAVMSRSLAPCLALGTPLALPMRKALVAIDRTETARGALLVALSWMSALRDRTGDEHPTLCALYVDTGDPHSDAEHRVDQKTIEHELDVLRRNAGSWARVTVVGDTIGAKDPATAIARYARDHEYELVVLGSRRPERDGAGLGSVSASVTTRLPIPVMLVPPA